MTMYSAIRIAEVDPVAMLLNSVTEGLDAVSAAAISSFFIDAELADFCWNARQRAAWIGEYLSFEDEAETLDRVAILSEIEGRYHVGIALVDGDGCVQDLRRHRSFDSIQDADAAFEWLRS